jgi:hypothetical protein
VLFIAIYRRTLGLVIGGRCRFYPSCSCYAQDALYTHGFSRGLWLTGRRLLRCHPFHPGGVDLVPPRGH